MHISSLKCLILVFSQTSKSSFTVWGKIVYKQTFQEAWYYYYFSFLLFVNSWCTLVSLRMSISVKEKVSFLSSTFLDSNFLFFAISVKMSGVKCGRDLRRRDWTSSVYGWKTVCCRCGAGWSTPRATSGTRAGCWTNFTSSNTRRSRCQLQFVSTLSTSCLCEFGPLSLPAIHDNSSFKQTDRNVYYRFQ